MLFSRLLYKIGVIFVITLNIYFVRQSTGYKIWSIWLLLEKFFHWDYEFSIIAIFSFIFLKKTSLILFCSFYRFRVSGNFYIYTILWSFSKYFYSLKYQNYNKSIWMSISVSNVVPSIIRNNEMLDLLTPPPPQTKRIIIKKKLLEPGYPILFYQGEALRC